MKSSVLVLILLFTGCSSQWYLTKSVKITDKDEVQFLTMPPFTRNQMNILGTSVGENVAWARLEIEIGFVINQGAASTWYARPIGL